MNPVVDNEFKARSGSSLKSENEYFLERAGRTTAVASATMVNRTHRVVRERAKSLQARRSKMRSLWIPLAVSGGLLLVIISAVWTILDEYELVPNGLVDANQQLLVLLMWCLPLSVVLLAVVWFRHGLKAENGNTK